MFVLEAIPLTKIPLGQPQILSYFSRVSLARGTLVQAPLSKAIVKAVVINSHRLENQKLKIRKGSFALKPIKAVIFENPVLTENQLKLAKYIAQNYVSSLGTALKLFVPQAFLKRKSPDKESLKITDNFEGTLANKKPQFLWSDNPASFYFEKIKEKENEKKGKVIFLVPNLEELIYWEDQLKGAFPREEIMVYHQGLKPKQKLAVWQESNRPQFKIIIGARSVMFLPFKELSLIVIEKEEDPGFKPFGQSPFYNAKEVALHLALLHNAQIVLSSSYMPSVETYKAVKSGGYELAKPFKLTQAKTGVKIIDLKKESSRKTLILSQELKKEAENVLAKNGKVLLFVNRKGFARVVVCKECGFVFKCEGCDSPMIYHFLQKPILLCHHCGAQKPAPRICPSCQGYKIEPLGAGAQRVAKEIRNLFPQANVLELDLDITPNEASQNKVVDVFLEKDASLLVATNLIFKFQKKLSSQKPSQIISAIISADSLLFFPEYLTRERFFQTVSFLQGFSQKVLLQTYNPDLDFLKYLGKNPYDFLSAELKLRQEFGYPPFSEIMRLTFSHSLKSKAQDEALSVRKKLQSIFKDEAEILGPFPGLIPKIKGKYLWHLLLRCQPSCQKIKAQIPKLLSPAWKIEINPENLL